MKAYVKDGVKVAPYSFCIYALFHTFISLMLFTALK